MNKSDYTRREFLAGITASSSAAAFLKSSFFFGSPVMARTHGTGQGPAGNTYDLLGYKRLIIDYHFSEFNPRMLEKANSAEIIETVTNLGVDSLLLYAKDHWGNVYHKSSFSKRHRNVPQDLFGEVLQGVKRHGVKVEAYTTVCWDEDSSRKHPDWVMLDANHAPIRINDGKLNAKWTFLCMNSPYLDYFLRQMQELIGSYDFEALFLDIMINHRALVCYNPFCLQKWKTKYGTDLPATLSDAEYSRYLDFNTETFESLMEQVQEIALSRRKKILLTHNFGLSYKYDDYIATEFDTHGADFYLPSIRAKLFRARGEGKEVELIGHRFNRLWDFTLKPQALMTFEVATALSHNCAMMYVDQPYFDGSLDPQVYAALKDAFVTADELSPYVKGSVPFAEVALLAVERSFELDYTTYRDFSGAYAMLSQLHWPFDVITGRELTRERLANWKAVIVPNTLHLSASQSEAIKEYVKNGGNLIFCYRAATIDDRGVPLESPSFGLVNIQGDNVDQVSFIRPSLKLRNRYLRTSAATNFVGVGTTEVLATINTPSLRVTDTEWVSHNIMPGLDTDQPAIVAGALGKGAFVYFSFRIFDDFVEQAQPDLRAAFEITMRKFYAPSLRVEAPGCIEAVFNQFQNKIRVVLVNGITSKVMTGDMWAGEKGVRGHVTIPETVPVHGIKVIAEGRVIAKAHDLRGQELAVSQEEYTSTALLPILGGYDVVEISFL